MMNILYKAGGLLLSLLATHAIYSMAQVTIKNNSATVYEYIATHARDECYKLSSPDIVTFAIRASHIKGKGEAYLEFYDLSQENVARRKSLGLCTFILYLYCEQAGNNQTNYRALLERKHPSTQLLKNVEVFNNPEKMNFRLTINNNLEESELSLVE